MTENRQEKLAEAAIWDDIAGLRVSVMGLGLSGLHAANALAERGADVIAYVRELDAESDDTLDQVEELQQRWVSATGVDQDIAGFHDILARLHHFHI